MLGAVKLDRRLEASAATSSRCRAGLDFSNLRDFAEAARIEHADLPESQLNQALLLQPAEHGVQRLARHSDHPRKFRLSYGQSNRSFCGAIHTLQLGQNGQSTSQSDIRRHFLNVGEGAQQYRVSLINQAREMAVVVRLLINNEIELHLRQ